MKRFTSQKQKIGEIGEKIAYMFLVKRGFNIIETNYTRKLGEIDIVAEKDTIIHFVEVKSVSCENISAHVARETYYIRPEHQFHVKKFRRFTKTVELYLHERRVSYETSWQIDLVTVYLDNSKRQGTVVPFWNVVF